MRVESRDLINLGQRQLHFRSERREMRGGEIAVLILNEMQMLNQKIAAAWPVRQKGTNFVERLRVDLPAFGCARCTAAAAGFCGTRTRRILNVHRLTSGTI